MATRVSDTKEEGLSEVLDIEWQWVFHSYTDSKETEKEDPQKEEKCEIRKEERRGALGLKREKTRHHFFTEK